MATKIFKHSVIFLILAGFFSCDNQFFAEPKDEGEEYLSLAYDGTYSYPKEFYEDPASPDDNVYYINTVSISPINQRDSEWIELSANNKNEALAWLNLTISNSSDRIKFLLIKENETEKYFEFEGKQITDDIYECPLLFRVHKTNYYHSIFDRSAPWNHEYETGYGHYNAEIEKSKVKECIEYLWVINTFANYGQKVLSSEIKETKEYFEVNICSLSITYGDWGLHDVVSVYDNYIRFNKSSRLITFQQSLRKQISGTYRPGLGG